MPGEKWEQSIPVLNDWKGLEAQDEAFSILPHLLFSCMFHKKICLSSCQNKKALNQILTKMNPNLTHHHCPLTHVCASSPQTPNPLDSPTVPTPIKYFSENSWWIKLFDHIFFAAEEQSSSYCFCSPSKVRLSPSLPHLSLLRHLFKQTMRKFRNCDHRNFEIIQKTIYERIH